jgi:nucleotide-binding universal stress UspA family protein
MKKKDVILVPTDYTAVAECATGHAIELAKTLHGEIALLHIIGNEKEMEATREKLSGIAKGIEVKHGITVHPVVRIGNIFEDIGEVASEMDAKLIIMGTHGVRGIQFITGSHALKVITASSVPFIVVQERNIKPNGYKNIVLPMDLTKESKQKVDITINMAKYFHSKVHIFAPLETDEFLANTVFRNLAFAKRELEAAGVSYDVKVADEKGSFVKQMLKFSAGIDADLVAIMNNSDFGLPEFLGGKEEQHIITNEAQIPVMCINPANVGLAGSVLFQ